MRARGSLRSRALFVALLAAFGWSILPQSGPVASDQSAAGSPIRREVPDDPPGEPARPIPGALPSPPIRLGSFTSNQVNVGPGGINIPGDAANEPSIAVDLTAPNRMAIGWRQFDTIASNFRQAGWAYSVDGGRTWTFPGVLEPGVFRSDPVLDYDAEGNFYYTSLKVVSSEYSCQVFKSKIGGIAWYPAVYAFGGDKAWTTVDRSGGIGHGNLYMSWSTAAGCCNDSIFTRSVDGAETFSIPVRITNTPVWGTMAVAPDGALYIAGVNINNTSQFRVAKSITAQDPIETPIFGIPVEVSLNGSLRAFAGSSSPNPGGLLGQVWIAVDSSGGPTEGNLYLLCSVDPFSADPLDVHFSRSSDGGETWSTPVRVNDDPLTNGAWQWFATMSVAPNGRIDVIWNDTRNTGAANLCQLYYSFSDDGGMSWSTNQPLSPVWDSHVGWPNQNKIGDYYDMISDKVGAHLAWAATFNGEQDVYYLRIGDYDCNANGVGDSIDIAMGTSLDDNENGIPDECENLLSGAEQDVASSYRLHQNIPNPFNPITTIRFDIPAGGSHVRLYIYDVTGRLIRTLANQFESAGSKSVLWDGRDGNGKLVASGLYFYRLEAAGFSETKKMVFLK